MVIGQTLGSYTILGMLGEGGMGEVCRARGGGRNRALRVLPTHFGREYIDSSCARSLCSSGSVGAMVSASFATASAS